jgi:hypothetical protein
MKGEIAASTKVRGKRWLASVLAAERKVKDDQFYFIRRHGSYFRPLASGYTNHLGAAGIYTGEVARKYLSVEGLSVIPLKRMRERLKAEHKRASLESQTLAHMLVNPHDLAAAHAPNSFK